MITLSYPYVTPTDTVTIKNPELGDGDTINLKNQVQQTMDSKIWTHKKTATSNRLQLTFRTLTRTAKDNVVGFYTRNIGNEFKYIDYRSDDWKVRFVNDTLQVTTLQDGCSYDVAFELITGGF